MILVKNRKERDKLPNWTQGWVKFPKGTYDADSDKPDYVVPLGDSGWPEEVKQKLVDLFKKNGIKDPLSMKLVEPYAIIFGGRDDNGAYNFAGVNWEMVVDYFEWEITSMQGDPDKIGEAMDRAMKKFGTHYSHKGVYEAGQPMA